MKRRGYMLIGLITLFVCGYWSGFGYYINMAASAMIPAQVVNKLREQINWPDSNLNLSKAHRSPQESVNRPDTLQTTILTNVGDKKLAFHENQSDSANDGHGTIPSHTYNDISTTVSAAPNITFYITTNNLRDGRLGNQMFRYASLIGIARAQGRQLIIPPNSELEDTFRLTHVSSVEGSNGWRSIWEANAYAFETKLLNLTLENYQIAGFLQSFHYFSHFIDEVFQEFRFKYSIIKDAFNILHDLHVNSTNITLIGVHVRRGDFLNTDKQNLGYGVPEKSYFFKAFDWMRKKFPKKNFIFLVASDDINWCKENLVGKDVFALPDASAAVHMAILANCDHVIISGGTFGWWSAFLSKGQVLYFTGFMQKGTTFGDQLDPNNYYPPLWIGFGN